MSDDVPVFPLVALVVPGVPVRCGNLRHAIHGVAKPRNALVELEVLLRQLFLRFPALLLCTVCAHRSEPVIFSHTKKRKKLTATVLTETVLTAARKRC